MSVVCRLAHLVVAGTLWLSATGPAALAQTGPAEDPPPHDATSAETPALSEQDLEALIATLEDPQRRQELLDSLQALMAARQETAEGPARPATADDAVGWLLREIQSRTVVVNQVADAITARLDDVPRLLEWAVNQVSEPINRELWLWTGYRVAIVLGLGVLAHLGIAFALRRMRGRLLEAEPSDPIERLPLAVGWLLIELLPVAAFGVVTLAALSLLAIQTGSRLVAMPLILAVIIGRAFTAFARVLFAPKTAPLRLLPLGDESAQYSFRWSRRIVGTVVYGYFALEAGWQLGLPWTLHGFLVHLLFFVITIMGAVVIVQRRQPVAAAIAGLGGPDRPLLLRRLPWATLASVWHVLAVLYVLSIYTVWALKIPGGFQALLEASVGSAGIAIGGWLLWRAVDRLFGRDVQVSDDSDQLAPGLEARASRYLPLLGTAARILVLAAAGVGLLHVWGFGTLEWLLSDAGSDFIGKAMTVLVIVVLTLGAWELITMMIERSIQDTDAEGNLRLSNRARTLLNITRNVLLVFLCLIAMFLVLTELGLNVAPLLAGAGVIGLAIGFGSQKLVQDIITGMFVLMGDTIRVGDVVEVAGRTGVVEAVTMRTVALRDLAGNLHTVPYGTIDTVMNYTKDFSYALLDIGVAYRENVDEVITVLKDLGAEMNRDAYFRRHILEPLEILGVDAFTGSAVMIRLRFKTRPLKQWEVGREFRRRIKNRFDELGIEIPFPHQTVYFGADKEGRAAPARVRVESGAAHPLEVREAEEQSPSSPALVARSGGS